MLSAHTVDDSNHLGTDNNLLQGEILYLVSHGMHSLISVCGMILVVR